MKVKMKVTERFIDALTGEQLEVGDIIEVSQERSDVMQKNNLATCITPPTSSKEKSSNSTNETKTVTP